MKINNKTVEEKITEGSNFPLMSRTKLVDNQWDIHRHELRQTNRPRDYDEVGRNYIKNEIYGAWVKGSQFMGLLPGLRVAYNLTYTVEKVSTHTWSDCPSAAL